MSGQREPAMRPQAAPLRMLQDASKAADRSNRNRPARGVLLAPTELLERAPWPARRMRHDRMRSVVLPGIPPDVPRVHTRQAEVAPVGLYEERGELSQLTHVAFTKPRHGALPHPVRPASLWRRCSRDMRPATCTVASETGGASER